MKKNESLHELLGGLKKSISRALNHKRLFLMVIFLSVLTAVLSPVNQLIWSKVIDGITYNLADQIGVFGYVFPSIFATVALYVIFLTVTAGLERYMYVVNAELREVLRVTYLADLAYHIFRLPLSVTRSIKHGEFTESSRKASSGLAELISNYVVTTGSDMLSAVIAVGIIFYNNHLIGAVTVVGILVAILVSSRDSDKILKLEKQSLANYKKAGGFYDDSIVNIKNIKDTAYEGITYKSLLEHWLKNAFPLWLKLQTFKRVSSYKVYLITQAVRATVLSYSVYLIIEGQFTLGILILLNSFVRDCIDPFISLLNNWREIQTRIISINESEHLLSLAPEKYNEGSGFQFQNGDINFESVTFSHQGNSQETLNNVSFDIKNGEKVAIVGESGVGKTTIIDIILGYHNLNSGKLLIDGKPLTDHDLNFLRTNTALVPQDTVLFNDTVKNNILFGTKTEVSDEQLQKIAKDSHCLDFINKFDLKWDQLVGDRGIKLSGGQRQRIAIARAMLRSPKILILDEPTSALDAGTEKIITESLERLMEGRTTIIIAHRLSTVRKADKIIVLKNSQVVEVGTHIELLKIEGGEYKRLHDLQIGLA
jgi:ABC-type multidrug transport system fused ATPase/permease subunit